MAFRVFTIINLTLSGMGQGRNVHIFKGKSEYQNGTFYSSRYLP